MRSMLCVLVLLLVPTRAWAQNGGELQIFLPGVDTVTGAPMTVSAIPQAAIVCAVVATPVATGTVTTPKIIEWDMDPLKPVSAGGLACRVDRTAAFLALPVGTGYRATVTVSNAAGPSPRSAASLPFDVTGILPAARTGLVVR